MSKIVKAKWVVLSPTVENEPNKNRMGENNHSLPLEVEENSISDIDNGSNGSADQIDHQLEAIRMANELMKSTLRTSREISEKSQEEGFDKGYSEGYQVGYETGFDEGVAKGRKAADQQVEAGLKEIKELVQAIQEDHEQAISQRQDQIIAIAMEIAKKIMRYEIKKDEENFIKIFHEVIHEDDEDVQIYLSEYQKSLDLHLQKSMIDKIKSLSKKMKVVLVKEDDKLVVETDQAVIDMAVPVQIEQIKKAFADNQ